MVCIPSCQQTFKRSESLCGKKNNIQNAVWWKLEEEADRLQVLVCLCACSCACVECVGEIKTNLSTDNRGITRCCRPQWNRCIRDSWGHLRSHWTRCCTGLVVGVRDGGEVGFTDWWDIFKASVDLPSLHFIGLLGRQIRSMLINANNTELQLIECKHGIISVTPIYIHASKH